MSQKYALFDFDGTLVARDSFMVLLQEGVKSNPFRVLWVFIFLPILMFFAFARVDRSLPKSFLLWAMTVGKSPRDVILFFRRTLLSQKRSLWFREVEKELLELKSQGIQLVIVTASGQNWARVLPREYGMVCQYFIGSKLRYFLGGAIFASKNCYHIEKVKQIFSKMGQEAQFCAGYSDHGADIPMLALCDRKVVISPKKRQYKKFVRAFGMDFEVKYWTAESENS